LQIHGDFAGKELMQLNLAMDKIPPPPFKCNGGGPLFQRGRKNTRPHIQSFIPRFEKGAVRQFPQRCALPPFEKGASWQSPLRCALPPFEKGAVRQFPQRYALPPFEKGAVRQSPLRCALPPFEKGAVRQSPQPPFEKGGLGGISRREEK
jgi:hypothetical protein